MTKYKIHETPEPQYECEKEETVHLALKQLGNEVRVVAVDEKGKQLSCGNILKFQSDGTLYLYTGVRVPGLKLLGSTLSDQHIEVTGP